MRQTAWIFILSFLGPLLLWGQEPVTYVVQPKDSLYSISRHFHVSPKALERANKIGDPRKIKVGQRLVIPSSANHPIPNSLSSPPETETELKSRPSPSPPPSTEAEDNSPSAPSEGESSGPSKSNPPAPRRYVFLDKVKDIIDAPHVIPGRWRYIVLHHSATPQGSARVFDIAHRNRGMENGLAYHFVIGNGSLTNDGEIEVGGRWLKQLKGGHLKFDSLNEISIGICFVGNFDETRPTRKQIAAAIELISYLREICGPVPPVLLTHTEIHPHHTDCPGKLFPAEAFHTLFPGEANQAELARLRAIPN